MIKTYHKKPSEKVRSVKSRGILKESSILTRNEPSKIIFQNRAKIGPDDSQPDPDCRDKLVPDPGARSPKIPKIMFS